MDHQVIGMDHALGKELPLDETEQVCHGRRTLDDHRAGLVRGVEKDRVADTVGPGWGSWLSSAPMVVSPSGVGD